METSFCNKKCMKFTVGYESDTMTTLAENFHRWVTAWCLPLDGPTVAQLGGILAPTVSEFRVIFLCFITVVI